MNGGYDDGYADCQCFWGREPARHVRDAAERLRSVASPTALDLGCGDGKNTAFLASRGFRVTAVEISTLALDNAKSNWKDETRGAAIEWVARDVREWIRSRERMDSWDLIVATGLLHCLRNAGEVAAVLAFMKASTRRGGFNAVAAFNERSQDLSGHAADFRPLLLGHRAYLAHYSAWSIVEESDSKQFESHPHNRVEHHHTITRLLAQRPAV